MLRKGRLFWLAVAVPVSVSACKETQQVGVASLELAYDGPVGLGEFVARSSRQEVVDVFADYQVGYVESTSEGDIAGCPKLFGTALTDSYHNFGGEYYYIDKQGRPDRVFVYYPPIKEEGRARTCQGNVGRWGDEENPGNDYDGGHLIGSQLGGWGARANLVPQDLSFNRGQYVRLENKIADCGKLSDGQLFYYVRVAYPDASTLIPDRYTIVLHDKKSGQSVELHLLNTDGGGEGGSEEVDRAVELLETIGC